MFVFGVSVVRIFPKSHQKNTDYGDFLRSEIFESISFLRRLRTKKILKFTDFSTWQPVYLLAAKELHTQ